MRDGQRDVVMSPPLRQGRRCYFLHVGLLCAACILAGAAVGGAAEPRKAPAPSAGPPPAREPAAPEPPTLEMTFATPKRFAIITELGSQRQRLYAVGDAIAEPQEPGRSVRIQQIEPKRLRLRDSQSQRLVWIAEGAVVPGVPSRRFTRTAVLRGLDHRYVATGAALDPEPRLLAIQGERALLEVDIHPPRPSVALAPQTAERPSNLPSARQPDPQKRDMGPFERVQVKQTAPDTYEISKSELRDALDHGGRVLAQEWPRVAPLLSIQDGVGLQVTSPVAEGTVSAQGFQITNPKLVARAGIEAGDVILAVNGLAVNSIGDLYRLYMQAAHDSSLSSVEVRLERKGVQLTKTYRVR